MGAVMSNMVLGSGGPAGENNNEEPSSPPAQSGFQKRATLADVVKQATSGVNKKLSAEEDILVMDTKLKIIEILQVNKQWVDIEEGVG